MKKFLNNFFTIIFSLLVISFFSSISYAADLNVDCTTGSCSKSGTEPLFSLANDGLWYPGKSLTKTINLKNSSSSTQEMDMRPIRTSLASILENVMQINITTNPGGSTIWSGNLASFYSQSRIIMGTFSSGTSQDFNFSATMDYSAGNEYQNLETVFDLILGFWEEDPANPTPTSTPTPQVGKTSSISLSCTNSNFDAVMELKDNGVPQQNVKVKFTYQGQTGEDMTDGDGKAQVGFTLDGEDKQVQAVPENGFPSQSASINSSSCSKSSSTPGPSPTPTPGGILGLFTNIFSPFTGTTEEILGEATEEAKITPTEIPGLTPAVQGVSTGCRCIWWPILLGEIVILLVFYIFFLKKYQGKLPKTFYFGVLIPVLTHIVFLWINRKCFGGFRLILFPSSNNLFCRYFLIINTFVYALGSIAWRKLFKEEKILVGKDEKN